MECWTRKTSRSTRALSHQDPFLMRHGSQPTANRPPHLVASYDTQGGAEDVFYPDVPTGFKNFRGKLFENSKIYAKSETTIQKALKERIPNHILHVQFERKTSVSQSNLLYPLYVYNYPNNRKCIHPFTSLQCIWFVVRKFFVENKLTRAYLKWGKGGRVNFQLFPFWGPFAI